MLDRHDPSVIQAPALKDLSKTATPHELQQLIPVITVLQLTRTSRGQILLEFQKGCITRTPLGRQGLLEHPVNVRNQTDDAATDFNDIARIACPLAPAVVKDEIRLLSVSFHIFIRCSLANRLMQANTHTENIGTLISMKYGIDKIRRHVIERAAGALRGLCPCPSFLAGNLKIDQFDSAIITNENVGRLDVAMNNLFFSRINQP